MDVLGSQPPPRKGRLRQCWYHTLEALTSLQAMLLPVFSFVESCRRLQLEALWKLMLPWAKSKVQICARQLGRESKKWNIVAHFSNMELIKYIDGINQPCNL